MGIISCEKQTGYEPIVTKLFYNLLLITEHDLSRISFELFATPREWGEPSFGFLMFDFLLSVNEIGKYYSD